MWRILCLVLIGLLFTVFIVMILDGLFLVEFRDYHGGYFTEGKVPILQMIGFLVLYFSIPFLCPLVWYFAFKHKSQGKGKGQPFNQKERVLGVVLIVGAFLVFTALFTYSLHYPITIHLLTFLSKMVRR